MNCLACFAVAQSASSGASASPQMITFGIAALAAGIPSIWAIRRGLGRKRTQALANAAAEIGFTFDGETRTPYLQTALFGKGRSLNTRTL